MDTIPYVLGACWIVVAASCSRSQRALLGASLLIQAIIVGPLSPPDDGSWSLQLLTLFAFWNLILWGILRFAGDMITRRNVPGLLARCVLNAFPIAIAFLYASQRG